MNTTSNSTAPAVHTTRERGFLPSLLVTLSAAVMLALTLTMLTTLTGCNKAETPQAPQAPQTVQIPEGTETIEGVDVARVEGNSNTSEALSDAFKSQDANLRTADFILQLNATLGQADPALVYDVKQVALAIKEYELTDAEKDYIAKRIQEEQGIEALFMNRKELAEAGILPEDQMHWEDGYILRVNLYNVTDSKIEYDCMLWRNGTGALMAQDNTSTFKAGFWSFKFNNMGVA